MIKRIAIMLLISSVVFLAFNNSIFSEPNNTEKTESSMVWFDILKKSNSEDLKGKILDIKKGVFISFDSLIKDISDVSIVFAGEMHTDTAHHQVQEKILKAMHEKHNNVVLGMEMFQFPYQKYLDLYIKGKISEEDTLRKTEYFKRWGYNWFFYKPMVEFAKNNNFRIIGFNISKLGRTITTC